MAEAVRYRVSMPQPHSHLYEVEAEFPPVEGPLAVALPVWTPGSYLVREFSRHLQEVSASTSQGQSLPVTRLDKRTFQVPASGKRVRWRYRVYANELTVRTSHLDGTHGFFNGATLFLYNEAVRSAQHRVSLSLPPHWRPFCSLDRDGEDFVASDYDELVDSPFELGPHEPLQFTASGVPHQIVVWGQLPVTPSRMTGDLQKICETEEKLFGKLPMRRYLFLLYLTDKGRGGLEHKASTALLFPRAQLAGKGWEDFLTLVAHEYFHLWNVKRIRPKRLVPFDYGQENYTELLWAFEGGTSYYDNLLVRRSGLMSGPRFLIRLGESLTALHSTPGRKVQNLAEASLAAWIKHYRPDENSPNSAISYYLKGEIVAVLLDLEIRRATSNKKSLDDVMRLLWSRYGDGRGAPEDGVERAAQEVAGADLSQFFERSIRSTEELDYSPFGHVGLEAKFRVRESTNDKGGTPPRIKATDVRAKGWLGVQFKSPSTLAAVLKDSPAMEAGLYAEDEVIALDGFRVDGATLVARCEEKLPGEPVKITVFRRDQLLEVPLTLGSKPADAVYFSRVENPTEAQKLAYRDWLKAEWDETEA
jgi:predicted metalloprotease with PDZ domain